MLATEDLIYETGLESPLWPILLEEADRYDYDDEKTLNLAKGIKIGLEYKNGECAGIPSEKWTIREDVIFPAGEAKPVSPEMPSLDFGYRLDYRQKGQW